LYSETSKQKNESNEVLMGIKFGEVISPFDRLISAFSISQASSLSFYGRVVARSIPSLVLQIGYQAPLNYGVQAFA
jgi:hypothetical protein